MYSVLVTKTALTFQQPTEQINSYKETKMKQNNNKTREPAQSSEEMQNLFTFPFCLPRYNALPQNTEWSYLVTKRCWQKEIEMSK